MDNQPITRTRLEVFFCIYVLVFSLMNISTQLLEGLSNYASLIISLIGISGCILMYRRNKNALLLLNIWAVSQLVIIMADESPVWSVEQVLSWDLYFEFTLISGTVIKLGVNVFAILLIYCVWKLRQPVVVRKTV